MEKTDFIPGKIYHIYNRGVNRQRIFFTTANMEFFLKRFKKYAFQERVSILCYCLMPNHFHLLVQITKEDFIKKVMQPFLTSYSKSINLRENRVGPLFQGNFKSKTYDRDETIVYVSKYIHQNPVKAGLVNHPAEWQYSSYSAYVRKTDTHWLETEMILSFFKSSQEYKTFVMNEDEP